VAAALLCGGLFAAGGGLGGLILLTGPAAQHGTSLLLAAHPGRPPVGAAAAPPSPATAARVARPMSLSIPVIGVHTLYRFRTRRRGYDLRFGWMSWLRQYRGSWLFVCST
jgi:hypothetical protein